MTAKVKIISIAEFWVVFLIIFCKNILMTYLFQSQNMGVADPQQLFFFNLAFNAFDWLVFWWVGRRILNSTLQNILMVVLSIIFTSIPLYFTNSPIRLDNDNLLVQAVCYFIPFLIFIFLKKSPKLIFLPILMGFIPLVNLLIANSFIGNLSFLLPFFKLGWLQWIPNDGFLIDFGLAFVQSIFWAALYILFHEINHQFFGLKSWRFDVEFPLKKSYLIIIFIVFKTLIYWMLSSLLIAMLGNSAVSLFSNKPGLVLSAIGFLGMLSISAIFFRKYITMYFYDKVGNSNWLYLGFFIPFIDILALIITLFVPFSISRKIINLHFSRKNLVYFVSVLLIGYALYSFWFHIRITPSSNSELRTSLILSRVGFPLIIISGMFLSLKGVSFYKIMIIFLFLLLPVFSLIILPAIEKSGNIFLLINTAQVFLHVGLFLFFVYPILYFKEFLKIK